MPPAEIHFVLGVGVMGQFSAQEQYFLELVNRSRMNPAAEATRYGISLNQNLASGTISSNAKQVLAPNALLHDAARAHTAHMIAVDRFAHEGIGDGDLGSRINDVGYSWSRLGENIAWTSQNSIDLHHQNLFKSAGHRENILSGVFKEVGIGSTLGTFVHSGTPWTNSLMTTQNFGTSTSAAFVTGVNYVDSTNNNNFYTIGEGITGRTVKLYQDGVLKTSASALAAGGYALKTSLTGKMEIVFSGTGLANDKGASFTLGSSNVKIDMVDSSLIEANVSMTLTRGATHARLLGNEKISAVGNNSNNYIYGNNGGNSLLGRDGVDKIHGGAGNDTLVGGRGADNLDGSSGSDKYRYYNLDEAGDTIQSFSSIDAFVFEGSAFGLGSYAGTLKSSSFCSGTGHSAKDTSDRFIYCTTDDELWFDSNGSAAGGNIVKIADIVADASVTYLDIIIV
jgi:Ca2+-binding RTX toxin-like protein